MPRAVKQIQLEIMFSEISQTQRKTLHFFSHMLNLDFEVIDIYNIKEVFSQASLNYLPQTKLLSAPTYFVIYCFKNSTIYLQHHYGSLLNTPPYFKHLPYLIHTIRLKILFLSGPLLSEIKSWKVYYLPLPIYSF